MIAAVENNRNLSLREIEAEISVPFSTARKFLREEKYNSYKYYKHQELKEEDKFQRATFCELIMEKANADRHFIENICFSDECTFTLHNKPNVQNFRYWGKTNAHEYVTTHTQYPQKINVWIGILKNKIIGPYFINGSLNGLGYYDMLVNNIGPAIDDLADDRQIIWFQQDGCPAHNHVIVRQYLDQVFPNTWIGTNGPVHWPARSPDLAPNDFFLWGHLKSKIYNNHKYTDIETLKNRITLECNKISCYQLANVRRCFYDRLGYCLARNGDIFEHLL